MKESELRRRLRAVLEDGAGPPPDFDATWRAATLRVRDGDGRAGPPRRGARLAWAGGAFATAACAMFAAWWWRMPPAQPPDGMAAADYATAVRLAAAFAAPSPLDGLADAVPAPVTRGLSHWPDPRRSLPSEETP